MKRMLAAAGAALFALSVATTADAAWIGSWGASPEPPTAAGGRFPATRSFENQTVRQVVRLSAGGERVRLRLTNAYGTKALRVGAVRVGLSDGKGGVTPGTEKVVTFGGGASALIAAGAPLVSDPIDIKAAPLSSLAVSIFLPEATGPCTCHGTGVQTAYIVPGDQTAAADMPADAATFNSRAFLAGVEVEAPDTGAKVIVAIGDSITDGMGSTVNANRRWPDILAERLAKQRGPVAVVNQGISGNRLLNPQAADALLARFDRDALAVPGVTHVIVFIGVNDLGRSEGAPAAAALFGPPDPVTAEDMIAGYRQLIVRARAAGVKIYGATIAPYEGVSTWTPGGEAKRVTINNWIRTSRAFDGVLDFDAAFRDPAAPTKMREGYHAGDRLHGSDAGYKAVAESIDLGLFR